MIMTSRDSSNSHKWLGIQQGTVDAYAELIRYHCSVNATAGAPRFDVEETPENVKVAEDIKAHVKLQDRVKRLKITDEEVERKLGWEKGTLEDLREFRAKAGAPFFDRNAPLEELLMEDELEKLVK